MLALLSASLRTFFFSCTFIVDAGNKANYPSNGGCCEVLVSCNSAKEGRVGDVHSAEVDELCLHAGGA